jgi:ribosome-binding factor A
MTRSHKHSAPSQRALRVGELVRHVLAAFFMRDEVEDPALAGVTITVPEVRVSADLRHATVFVMPLGGAHAPEVAAALNRHQRFIRGAISGDLDLKFIPDLKFEVDPSFAEADRIEALLKSERVARDLRADEKQDAKSGKR